MAGSSLDVQRLIKLIKYEGPMEDTLEVLNKLCLCFISTIPFTTINMTNKEPKDISIEKIYENIVVKEVGGFCFELNGLLYWLLKQFGFQAELFPGYSFMSDKGVLLDAFNHVTIMVSFKNGENMLTDVSRGGHCFVYPLKMNLVGKEQTQTSGIFRIVEFPNKVYGVEKKKQREISAEGKVIKQSNGDEWMGVFGFRTVPKSLEDFRAPCLYAQYQEPFLTSTCIALLHKSRSKIYMFGNTYFEKEYIDPMTVRVAVNHQCKNEEWHEILKTKFNLEFDKNVLSSSTADLW